MAPERLQWLYKRYEASLDPASTKSPSRSFPEEIARLLARSKDGKSHIGCRINAASQASIGEDAMTTHRTSFLTEKQRFLSPLTVDLNTTEYWCLHADDRVFGVHVNAYTCRWQGASQAHPVATPPEMEKAMRWAITSTTQSVMPTLTALILPDLPNSAYAKWLSQPCVHILMRLNK